MLTFIYSAFGLFTHQAKPFSYRFFIEKYFLLSSCLSTLLMTLLEYDVDNCASHLER